MSLLLAHTEEEEMREKEELKRAVEQNEQLLFTICELEEKNLKITKEKNDLVTKYKAVSLFIFAFNIPRRD